MNASTLIRKLRAYDKHNHRGKYAVLCHEAADFVETAFQRMGALSSPPETPTTKIRPGLWKLTPKGFWGEQQCEEWIKVIRNHGSNALIVNENGELEFGVVERDAAGDDHK